MYTEVSLQYPLETCKCVGRLGIYPADNYEFTKSLRVLLFHLSIYLGA